MALNGICSEGMMDIREAMAFTKLSHSELYHQMGIGNLKYVMHGKRRLIPKLALEEMLERGLVLKPKKRQIAVAK